jgi:hypothetical protein
MIRNGDAFMIVLIVTEYNYEMTQWWRLINTFVNLVHSLSTLLIVLYVAF